MMLPHIFLSCKKQPTTTTTIVCMWKLVLIPCRSQRQTMILPVSYARLFYTLVNSNTEREEQTVWDFCIRTIIASNDFVWMAWFSVLLFTLKSQSIRTNDFLFSASVWISFVNRMPVGFCFCLGSFFILTFQFNQIFVLKSFFIIFVVFL